MFAWPRSSAANLDSKIKNASVNNAGIDTAPDFAGLPVVAWEAEAQKKIKFENKNLKQAKCIGKWEYTIPQSLKYCVSSVI